MKTLCLLTNEFPYGTWEPFLETETKYYTGFDEIIICSLQLRDEHRKVCRNLDINAKVVPVKYLSRLRYFLGSVFAIFDKNLYSEFFNLKRSGRLSFKKIVCMFVFLSRAHIEAMAIDKVIRGYEKSDFIFYSYRFEYQPYIPIILNKKWNTKCKIICRAHGYDLYDYAHKENYIPFRKTILRNVDYVFPCSEDGTRYLRERFPEHKDKIHTRFLGTVDRGIQKYVKRDCLRLVSCSNIIKVKRLDRIANALSKIENLQIEWTHFGDGSLKNEIIHMCNKMPSNIKADFRGHISNQELLSLYKREVFDLFINVSESEGIPVSIMEAISFGIPCIATDVGGTPEIVKNGLTGKLLPSDCTDDDIKKAIMEIADLDESSYLSLRESSRLFWEENYNAEKNYTGFIDELIGLE